MLLYAEAKERLCAVAAGPNKIYASELVAAVATVLPLWGELWGRQVISFADIDAARAGLT